MKLIRIYKWIIIAIVLQVLILAFINNIYLTRNGEVKVTSLEVEDKPEISSNVKVPADAENIKISFNGAYAAYILAGNMEIIDMQTKEAKKTIRPSKDILSYYRWLPDRNMVIYSTRAQDSEPGRVEVITYDVDSGIERSYPKISSISRKSEITDIELSPLTNVVYVKVKSSDSGAKVYKYNIMDHVDYTMNASTDTVIKETNYSDKLIYQDSKNKLLVRDGTKNTTSTLPFKNKMVLLAIDAEDKIYAGELNKEGKVGKIYYGKLTTDQKAWTQSDLKSPALPEDIVVTRNGVMFEVLKNENAVRNIKNDNKISYEGKFIDIIDGYIVTVDNNKLKFSTVKADEAEVKQ